MSELVEAVFSKSQFKVSELLQNEKTDVNYQGAMALRYATEQPAMFLQIVAHPRLRLKDLCWTARVTKTRNLVFFTNEVKKEIKKRSDPGWIDTELLETLAKTGIDAGAASIVYEFASTSFDSEVRQSQTRAAFKFLTTCGVAK